MIPAPGTDRNRLVATTAGLFLGGLAYFLTLSDYRLSLTRTTLQSGLFSTFYDQQARAILDGHLDVPKDSLGIEGFVHDGKTFMYFPPWPAILRLPVLLTTHEYDGRLTLLSMAIAWIVFAVVVVKLVWFLLPRLAGTDEVSGGTAAVVALFLAAATGGTFLTFDAGQPWVYHEAYVWAVASVMGGIYWLIRLLFEPTRHATWWLFVFCLLSVGSRATEGWAISLAAIALGAYWRLWPRRTGTNPLWWRVLLAGAVPLVLSIALNEYKFGTVYIFPLQDQVWTFLNEHRREALAANGGGLTGPQFFTTSFMAYLRLDGIRFVDYFPFVTLPAHAAPAYGGAFIDQSYRTGSVTAFMPLLMLMFLVALVAVAWPRARRELALLRLPMLVSILVTGGVMGYGYYSARYATEFVPAMVLGGAITTTLLVGLLRRHRAWRAPALAVLAAGAVFSMLAQMSIGTTMQAYIHRGDALQRYLTWQHDVSPGGQAALVTQVEGLPTGGSTDDLAIRGNCDSLYLNTGDRYQPWIPVEERDRVLELSATGPTLHPGQVTLLTVSGTDPQSVRVEVDRHQRLRFVTRYGDAYARTDWFDMPTDGGVRLGVRNQIAAGFFQFVSTPGGQVGYLPSVYFDRNENSLPALLTVGDSRAALAALGLSMRQLPGLPMTLCEDLAREAGIDVSGRS
ncbi:MAG TPA: hypothetical protein VH228_01575 [Nocardioides sp.]|nr:hypothetical protein [Nocardioides sp.]